MKKKICILLATAIMVFCCVTTHADNVAVIIDGQYLGMDVPAQIMNERTMVPMRAIFEALGATVDWDGDSQTITAKTLDKTIIMQIDSSNMDINGTSYTLLDQTPVIVDGRTLVPARAVSEALDATVGWDGANSTVNIDSGNAIMASPAYFYKGNAYYSLADEPAIYVWDGNTNYRYAAGGVPSEIVVYNDYIFYYNASASSICRMNLDGSDRKILTTIQYDDFMHNVLWGSFAIKNNQILYLQSDEDNETCQIFSMDSDGNNKRILAKEDNSFAFGIFKGAAANYSDKPWAISKNYIYYGTLHTTYDEDGYAKGSDCNLYRYSFNTERKELINDIGDYILQGMDSNSNVLLSNVKDSDTYYIINDEKNLVPYSSLVQYSDQWWYYGSNLIYMEQGKLYRKHLVTGEYELLADGNYLGSDEETILYSVTTPKTNKTYKSQIVSQQIYAMDVDGNNIRLVNEYSNGSAVQSNTAFDNTQPENQQTTCAVCHGLGYYDCPICHGEGTVKKYTRAGLEVKTCTHCGGRKHISCTVCGGDGILHN